jgi:hypothetical protein
MQNELTKKTNIERDLSEKIGGLEQNITRLSEIQVLTESNPRIRQMNFEIYIKILFLESGQIAN